MTYPEHEKLAAVQVKSQAAGELLEWLASQGVQLMAWKEWTEPDESRCSWHGLRSDKIRDCDHCDERGMVAFDQSCEGFVTWSSDIQGILAKWLGIDLDKLEREKRTMLASLAEVNGRVAEQPTEPLLDADGVPVPLPDNFVVTEEVRAFFAGRVPARACPHYIAVSEARVGIDRCERCA